MEGLYTFVGKPITPIVRDIDHVLGKIGWNGIIDAVAETFIEEAHGRTEAPPKTLFNNPSAQCDVRFMPAKMDKYSQYWGNKTVTTAANNPSYGLPNVMARYELIDSNTGAPLMIADATTTTAYRTAAATAVACRELSFEDPKTLGIIGAGLQAKYHIPAIKAAVDSLDKVLVFDIYEDRARKFAEDNQGIYARKQDLMDESDIVVTLTPSKEPHIDQKNYFPKPNSLLCSVGGDAESKIEVHANALHRLDYFCDSFDQVMHTGTFVQAKENNVDLTNLKSLGQKMIGDVDFNKDKDRRAFFSTGVALEDLAINRLLYEHFREHDYSNMR